MAWPLSWDRIDLSSVRRNTVFRRGDALSLSLSISSLFFHRRTSIAWKFHPRENFSQFFFAREGGLSLQGMEIRNCLKETVVIVMLDRFFFDELIEISEIEHFCEMNSMVIYWSKVFLTVFHFIYFFLKEG